MWAEQLQGWEYSAGKAPDPMALDLYDLIGHGAQLLGWSS
jgi:hypothetical protein